MKLSDAFPSKWLKADDIEEDSDMVVTIKSAELEPFQGNTGKPEQKLILSFREVPKGLVMNKTNSKTIAKLYGDDTDDWIGKKVALFATEVEYGGEQMLGIRIRSRAPAARKPFQGKPAPGDTPAADYQPASAEVVEDSDIPF